MRATAIFLGAVLLIGAAKELKRETWEPDNSKIIVSVSDSKASIFQKDFKEILNEGFPLE